MEQQYVALHASNFYIPLVVITVLLAAIIVGLDSAWRLQRRLSTFIGLLVAGVAVLAVRKILEIMGFTDTDFFTNFFQYLDVFMSLLFLIAFIEMFRIVRSLDREDGPRK